MGARNRTQQNLEIVRTDVGARPDLRQGLGPGPQGRLAAGQGRGQGRPPGQRALSRRPHASSARRSSTEEAPAGLVEEAAVHEIPALPGDEEVAAIAAEQEAGAAEAAAAEADAAEGRPSRGSGRRREQGRLIMKVKVQTLDGGKGRQRHRAQRRGVRRRAARRHPAPRRHLAAREAPRHRPRRPRALATSPAPARSSAARRAAAPPATAIAAPRSSSAAARRTARASATSIRR